MARRSICLWSTLGQSTQQGLLAAKGVSGDRAVWVFVSWVFGMDHSPQRWRVRHFFHLGTTSRCSRTEQKFLWSKKNGWTKVTMEDSKLSRWVTSLKSWLSPPRTTSWLRTLAMVCLVWGSMTKKCSKGRAGQLQSIGRRLHKRVRNASFFLLI